MTDVAEESLFQNSYKIGEKKKKIKQIYLHEPYRHTTVLSFKTNSSIGSTAKYILLIIYHIFQHLFQLSRLHFRITYI